MNPVLLLIISLLAALGGNIVRKLYTHRESGMLSTFLCTAVVSVVSGGLLLLLGGFPVPSLFTVLLGILFGVIITLQLATNLVALELGPLAYTTVIISFSTLITALSGALFFGESLSPLKLFGIALMLVSFALAAERGKDDTKHANLRWLLFCAAAFLLTGGIGLLQKIHQSSPQREELNAFLIIAFAVSALLSALVALFLHRRASTKGEKTSPRPTLYLLFLMAVIGICTGLNHKLNLYLSGIIDSAVFFPVVNGGGLILSTLAALVLFRERLTARQWAGVIIGTLSVIVLCLG